jgi:hypothetical protein
MTRRTLAWRYGLVVGVGLALEGGLLLLLQALNLMSGDAPHNAVHLVWGLVLLALLRKTRSPWVVIGFGVFYTALAIAGIVTTNPLGLQLGPGENVFHSIVGSLALVFGVVSLSSDNKPATSGAEISPGAGGARY